MAGIEIENLSKTYPNGVAAVVDLTLLIEPGELMVLVGPSGCGKTTTLRLIAGLESADHGRIFVNGQDVTKTPPHRRDVAMVFQRPALLPHLTVRQNLQFELKLRENWCNWLRASGGRQPPVLSPKQGADARRSPVEEAARLLHLEELLERRPRELSGGQQQRVALGRALVRRTAVLLLDEPLGGMDARLRWELRRELDLLHSRLLSTIVHVTHDQEEALILGDRVAVLDRGRLQQVDRPTALLQRPSNRFVAEFLGWPPMSFLEGAVDIGERPCFRGPGGRVSVPPQWAEHAGRSAFLGVRAEHVHLPSGATCESSLSMEVRQIEPLGTDRLVTLTRNGWWLTTRVDGSLAVRERSIVEVALDLRGAHLFDAATGRALSHGTPAG